MARLARVVAPGLPHHVTQRGNRRQTVFFRRGLRGLQGARSGRKEINIVFPYLFSWFRRSGRSSLRGLGCSVEFSMIKEISTWRLVIFLLKGMAFWFFVVVVVRSFGTVLFINLNIREYFYFIGTISPLIVIDIPDIIFYVFSGLILSAIFWKDTVGLAVMVWCLDTVFWLIVARPFTDVGEVYLPPFSQLGNAFASYVIVPGSLVIGAAIGRHVVVRIRVFASKRENSGESVE